MAGAIFIGLLLLGLPIWLCWIGLAIWAFRVAQRRNLLWLSRLAIASPLTLPLTVLFFFPPLIGEFLEDRYGFGVAAGIVLLAGVGLHVALAFLARKTDRAASEREVPDDVPVPE